jgi:hypothetical protein
MLKLPTAFLAPMLLLTGLATPSLATPVLIDFSNAADFTDNFTVLQTGSPALAWSSDQGGILQRLGPATPGTHQVASVIYEPVANGPVFDLNDGPLVLSVKANAELLANGGTSIGFSVSTNNAKDSAYAAIFRLKSTSLGIPELNPDFRLFDTNGNPSAGSVGTLLGTSTWVDNSLSANTWYTLRLVVQENGGNVDFIGSILDESSNVLHTFNTLTDTTSPVLSGLVGLRLGSDTIPDNGVTQVLRIDDFAIGDPVVVEEPAVAVPEPAGLALLGVAGLSLFARRRRV